MHCKVKTTVDVSSSFDEGRNSGFLIVLSEYIEVIE